MSGEEQRNLFKADRNSQNIALLTFIGSYKSLAKIDLKLFSIFI